MQSFEVISSDGVKLNRPPFESCAEAAQEAEYLHAETGKTHHVVDTDTEEVYYESKGGPE